MNQQEKDQDMLEAWLDSEAAYEEEEELLAIQGADQVPYDMPECMPASFFE